MQTPCQFEVHRIPSKHHKKGKTRKQATKLGLDNISCLNQLFAYNNPHVTRQWHSSCETQGFSQSFFAVICSPQAHLLQTWGFAHILLPSVCLPSICSVLLLCILSEQTSCELWEDVLGKMLLWRQILFGRISAEGNYVWRGSNLYRWGETCET